MGYIHFALTKKSHDNFIAVVTNERLYKWYKISEVVTKQCKISFYSRITRLQVENVLQQSIMLA